MQKMNWWDNRDLSQSIEIEDISIGVRQTRVLHRDGTVTLSEKTFCLSQLNFKIPEEKSITGIRVVDIMGSLGATGESTQVLWKE